MSVPRAVITTVSNRLQKLNKGDLQALQIPHNLPGLRRRVPGRAFFELMDSIPAARQHRDTWNVLVACWALNPQLHDPTIGVGTAFHRISKDRQSAEDYFLAVLNAHEGVLLSMMHDLGRRLASAGQSYDFGEFASLALNPHDEDLRLKVAEDFYA